MRGVRTPCGRCRGVRRSRCRLRDSPVCHIEGSDHEGSFGLVTVVCDDEVVEGGFQSRCLEEQVVIAGSAVLAAEPIKRKRDRLSPIYGVTCRGRVVRKLCWNESKQADGSAYGYVEVSRISSISESLTEEVERYLSAFALSNIFVRQWSPS
jgi:hypothetical protein